jgi:hypothetical protein
MTYKQYSVFDANVWKRLAREGIQTMWIALLCNIISIIIFYNDTANKGMFILIDW